MAVLEPAETWTNHRPESEPISDLHLDHSQASSHYTSSTPLSLLRLVLEGSLQRTKPPRSSLILLLPSTVSESLGRTQLP